MKRRIILFILSLLYFGITYSQITTDSAKRIMTAKPLMVKQVRVIPSAKAIMIRKDAIQLKLQLSQLSDSIAITKKDIDNIVDKMKNDLDSMSEMGETESLRLQMAMDRMSKMMSSLSNLLKKMSETSQSITQNLK